MHNSSFRVIRCKGIAGSNSGSSIKNLDTGTKISPQFSILAIMDVLYSYYFANDSYFKTQKYKATLSAIRAKGEHTEDKDE